MILVTLVLIPLIFTGLVIAAPAKQARNVALAGTTLALGVLIAALMQYRWEDAANQDNFGATLRWLPQIGLTFKVGADSVSMLLIALTVLLGPICVLASTTAITQRVKTYYAWLLVLQGAMTGVFAARDLILFYTCFEFTLVPMFVLISLYGSTNRKKAAI